MSCIVKQLERRRKTAYMMGFLTSIEGPTLLGKSPLVSSSDCYLDLLLNLFVKLNQYICLQIVRQQCCLKTTPAFFATHVCHQYNLFDQTRRQSSGGEGGQRRPERKSRSYAAYSLSQCVLDSSLELMMATSFNLFYAFQ